MQSSWKRSFFYHPAPTVGQVLCLWGMQNKSKCRSPHRIGTSFTQHEKEFEPETDLNKRIMEKKRTSIDISHIPFHYVVGVKVIVFEACILHTKVHGLLLRNKTVKCHSSSCREERTTSTLKFWYYSKYLCFSSALIRGCFFVFFL